MIRRSLLRIVLLTLLVVSAFATLARAQDAQPDSVTIAGTVQSVLGCPGDWQPECDVTHLVYDADDDLWTAAFDLPAGSYEYKAALNGSWDENYGLNAQPGGANIPLVLAEDATVQFFYDHQSHWITDSVNSLVANVPGSFQSEIGCPGDWQPDCLRSWLQDPDGDGVYVFTTSAIPPGVYEAKVAINQSWSLNYGADGASGGANILFTVAEENTLVEFSFNTADNVMTINAGGDAGPAVGNLFLSQAQWITADTIAWDISRIPGASIRLHYSPTAELMLTAAGIEGGESIELTADRAGLSEETLVRYPHLADYSAFKISEADLALVPEILRAQVAVSSIYNGDVLQDATGVQLFGALDDRYTYDGALGVAFADGVPTLRVWAPTAQNVRVHVFADAQSPDAEVFDTEFDPETGVWSVAGDASWVGSYYLYEVTVYSYAARTVVTNLVTDPYSVALAANSARTMIVDLDDPALMPDGWVDLAKPPLAAPEDIVIYELHVRDFSINDATVPEEHRGRFLAFTDLDTDGMLHLRGLAEAGLTHLHLLPPFDFATVNENEDEQVNPDPAELAALPPDSDEQQAIIEPLRAQDGFNWGYDPVHYSVPEGSYATDPNGTARVLEFRQMVQSLNESGLRVVVDVVYNHTSRAGQDDLSVLDKIVPGYYHRLNRDGFIETSTCCQNTATEHRMMEKLMIDSVLLWATAYKVDAFRFDLMGHHMVENMVRLRAELDALTIEADGVDGQAIYVYGEGWNFGEVADNARGLHATQRNMAGTGIGTFSDRLRDAVRGGSPFGGLQEQGFSSGLYVDPSDFDGQGTPEEQLARSLQFTDIIRLGMAGNLRDYAFTGSSGDTVTGATIDYNGQPAGYTADPQEHIVYVSKHDNETLFDVIQLKAPLDADMATRVRMHNLALSITMFSQGVPFFQAGDDLLRSKSLDRDSYDSGDWFNRLFWDASQTNWGAGLPPAGKNEERWELIAPYLANPAITPTADDVARARDHFREILRIRQSSPLFRLQTAEAIMSRVAFHNGAAEPIPGVIVMSLDDTIGADLDPNAGAIVVVINATPETQSVTLGEGAPAVDSEYALHDGFASSTDAIVQESAFADGAFSVPAYTVAVFSAE